MLLVVAKYGSTKLSSFSFVRLVKAPKGKLQVAYWKIYATSG